MRRSIPAAVAAALSVVACVPPGPKAGARETAAIARASYAAPGGGRVSYLHAGAPGGRRVVFLHGTPGHAAGWADYLLHVPPGFEYIAVDRPGFGASTPEEAESSLARQAAAVLPLLEARGGHAPILVGHSYGGPVAARLAAEHPDRVSALVILAGALDPAQEHVLAIQRLADTATVSPLLPRMLRNANRELIPLKAELEALAPLLPRITAPVTILHGTADRNVPYANVAYMTAHLTHARRVQVVTFQRRNHFLPWNERPAVEAAIAEAATL